MRCHGPNTASNARKRPIGTNSKSKAAIAWNCWRPKHQSGGNHDGRGSSPAPVVFLPGARTAFGALGPVAVLAPVVFLPGARTATGPSAPNAAADSRG